MSAPRWHILYRGPLSSCNYACSYCPFAKTKNTREELIHDADCLNRFLDWVATREEQIGVLFTPWGEAMIHRHYQEAMRRLSHLPNVWKVAAQTNLSFPIESLRTANRATTALWTTFHPSETTVERFAERCARLRSEGLIHSVGTVGTKDAIPEIIRLRSMLPAETYLWVNAWKREKDYYSIAEIETLEGIDPLFHWNADPHPSLGKSCRAGHTAFTVDGKGDVRRCHFIKEIIGNIYIPGFESTLAPQPCSIGECRCHIGYVHMKDLQLDSVFGDGILERVPIHFQVPVR